MEPIGALPREVGDANSLKVMVGPCGLEPQTSTVSLDHFVATELARDQVEGGKSHATKTIYRDFLTRWVKPTWGSLIIRDVRTIAVENWLRRLLRVDGRPLANATKAKSAT